MQPSRVLRKQMRVRALRLLRTSKIAELEVVLKAAESGSVRSSLLPVRAAGVKWCKLKLQALNGGRSHIRVKVGHLQRSKDMLGSGSEMTGLKTSLTAYEAAVQHMQNLGCAAAEWTAENVQAKVSELLASAGEVESALSALQAAYDTAVVVRAGAKKDRETDRKAKSQALHSHIRPFLDKGVQPVWANKLHQLGFTHSVKGSDVEPGYAASEDNVEHEYTTWERPAWFELDKTEEGQEGILTAQCCANVVVGCCFAIVGQA